MAASIFSCSPKTTAAATEGGVDWAARAAAYKKNPESLRQFVEDCEYKDEAIGALELELTNRQAHAGAADFALSEAQNQLADAQAEAQQLRNQLAQAQADLAAAPKQDEVVTDAMVPGVIFQVQLGAFAKNTVDPDLATGEALELQEQDGLQKFVVSQFRTYATAAQLRDRLKAMGVKGAFVVAKNNGQRISVPEALEMTGQGE
jgi:hypothetical protein